MLEPALSYERVLNEVCSATPVGEGQTIEQWLRHTARLAHRLLDQDKPPLPRKTQQLAKSEQLLARHHSQSGIGGGTTEPELED
jgi:hypothetical protein